MPATVRPISKLALSADESSIRLGPQTGSDGRARDVLVHLVAANMFLIECAAPLRVSDRLEIFFDGNAAATVIWVGGRLALCTVDAQGPSTLSVIDHFQYLALAGGANEGWRAGGRVGAVQDPAAFGKKLQALRVERGLKQSDIAEQLCVSTAAVSQWESGRMVPREERWRELADCLGVGITDLTSNQSTSDLRQLISASRAEIAQAAGIEPANVRILLDM